MSDSFSFICVSDTFPDLPFTCVDKPPSLYFDSFKRNYILLKGTGLRSPYFSFLWGFILGEFLSLTFDHLGSVILSGSRNTLLINTVKYTTLHICLGWWDRKTSWNSFLNNSWHYNLEIIFRLWGISTVPSTWSIQKWFCGYQRRRYIFWLKF